MKAASTLCLLGLTGLLLGGCEPGPPENAKPADGSNPRVGGPPQERIQKIQNDPVLTPAEKEMRIKAVKERNHLP